MVSRRLHFGNSGFQGLGEPRTHHLVNCRTLSRHSTGKDFIVKDKVSAGDNDDTVHVITQKEETFGATSRHEFQANTKQLLDIVAKTLYSEKEVFIREIVSNASDALEKLKYQVMIGEAVADSNLPLQINICTDQESKTLTIMDHGVGMTEKEVIDNLGTIARSGSKEFLQNLEEQGKSDSEAKSIIGQFGVGFYSAFMVADKVDVFTRSYAPGSEGLVWTSDGSGAFDMARAKNVSRGTKVMIHLKDEYKNFSIKTVVEDIVKTYSNFVSFPIFLDGTLINTVQALWVSDPKSVSIEDHKEFYKFIAKTYDEPRYVLHFKTDAPLNIRSLFYIPETPPPIFAMQHMEPGVSLYSRKVLIQSKASKLLPHWLWFVKGVVDSEDIPLNLSREILQDSAIIRKLSDVLAARLVKFLLEQQKKDRVKYEMFYKDFATFFREGVVVAENDEQRENIGKLLLFESSNEKPGVLTSLSVYASRMKPTQEKILYLCAPSREIALGSPYYEVVEKEKLEVLFTYNEQDDIALHYLKTFGNKGIMSVENFLSNQTDSKPVVPECGTSQCEQSSDSLKNDQAEDLANWMSVILGKEKVSKVMVSRHLPQTSHPAMVTLPDMAAAKQWLKVTRTGQFQDIASSKYQIFQPSLEINPRHELIKHLEGVRLVNAELAALVTHQLFDNAMMSAGLLHDPRTMLGRLNSLLEAALDSAEKEKGPKSSM